MNLVEGLKPWEVMQQHMEEGKRVANFSILKREWLPLIHPPQWNWGTQRYAIIDDTQPEIDWDEFDWDFFRQYDGVPALDEIIGGKPSLPLRLHRTTQRHEVQLRESPFYPWFGGECPVPGKVEIEIEYLYQIHNSSGKTFERNRICKKAYDVDWGIDTVIAFRLTGRVLP